MFYLLNEENEYKWFTGAENYITTPEGRFEVGKDEPPEPWEYFSTLEEACNAHDVNISRAFDPPDFEED